MARVKTGMTTKARHNKILKRAKGYFCGKSIRFTAAKEAVMKSLNYSYVGRKLRRRDFRKLWIARINAGARINGTTYSKMVNGLKKSGITVNRKMLADLAITDEKAFAQLAEMSKKA
ncbi:MAG: 50S ribosomal protein L20 [Clostridia bacterium]|nr:50S ribosomal protein L20 [Clostridia bacterium]